MLELGTPWYDPWLHERLGWFLLPKFYVGARGLYMDLGPKVLTCSGMEPVEFSEKWTLLHNIIGDTKIKASGSLHLLAKIAK